MNQILFFVCILLAGDTRFADGQICNQSDHYRCPQKPTSLYIGLASRDELYKRSNLVISGSHVTLSCMFWEFGAYITWYKNSKVLAEKNDTNVYSFVVNGQNDVGNFSCQQSKGGVYTITSEPSNILTLSLIETNKVYNITPKAVTKYYTAPINASVKNFMWCENIPVGANVTWKDNSGEEVPNGKIQIKKDMPKYVCSVRINGHVYESNSTELFQTRNSKDKNAISNCNSYLHWDKFPGMDVEGIPVFAGTNVTLTCSFTRPAQILDGSSVFCGYKENQVKWVWSDNKGNILKTNSQSYTFTALFPPKSKHVNLVEKKVKQIQCYAVDSKQESEKSRFIGGDTNQFFIEKPLDSKYTPFYLSNQVPLKGGMLAIVLYQRSKFSYSAGHRVVSILAHWLKDNVSLPGLFTNGALLINNFTESDSTVYSVILQHCTLKHQFFCSKLDPLKSVYTGPHFITVPKPTMEIQKPAVKTLTKHVKTFLKGFNYAFQCISESVPYDGVIITDAFHTWYKDGKIIIKDNTDKYMTLMMNSTSENGKYACQIQYRGRKSVISDPLTINVDYTDNHGDTACSHLSKPFLIFSLFLGFFKCAFVN